MSDTTKQEIESAEEFTSKLMTVPSGVARLVIAERITARDTAIRNAEREKYKLSDAYMVVTLPTGQTLPEGSLCMWPHTNQGWEGCGGLHVINGPIFAIPKAALASLKEEA